MDFSAGLPSGIGLTDWHGHSWTDMDEMDWRVTGFFHSEILPVLCILSNSSV
jgi:hypothetical protein